MIAVNELIQKAYQAIGMTGLGEAAGDYAEDNMPIVACDELNRLIAKLNNEGYLAMAQKWVDAPCAKTIYFRKLVQGEEKPNTVDMEPPQPFHPSEELQRDSASDPESVQRGYDLVIQYRDRAVHLFRCPETCRCSFP